MQALTDMVKRAHAHNLQEVFKILGLSLSKTWYYILRCIHTYTRVGINASTYTLTSANTAILVYLQKERKRRFKFFP